MRHVAPLGGGGCQRAPNLLMLGSSSDPVLILLCYRPAGSVWTSDSDMMTDSCLKKKEITIGCQQIEFVL